MNNFELIDDYLTNKLSDSQRQSFEQQVSADPSLKADVEFQRQVIESVKNARAAELKSMLNNVPISPAREFTTLKVAAGIVGGALLIASIYVFNKKEINQPIITEPEDSIAVVSENEVPPTENTTDNTTNEVTTANADQEESKTETKATTSIVKKDVVKPAIEVIDPSTELVESTSSPVNHGATVPTAPPVEAKALEVAVDSTNKKYKFHYQFAAGKVLLYGSFDSSLYEIIELNGGKRAVYLYHQNKYYALNEQSTEITPLQALTDKAAIVKLEAYRKK
jgi:hypothetical protein